MSIEYLNPEDRYDIEVFNRNFKEIEAKITELEKTPPQERPIDWLSMPTPEPNEIYLLFHIPDGLSGLIAFTVTCTGSYTVETGTVTDGEFITQTSESFASGAKYEAELYADAYGDLTSDGFKQAMVKVSGDSIKTWVTSPHSKRNYTASFASWNIVEISCELPSGTRVQPGEEYNRGLRSLRYFSWYGTNNLTSADRMFQGCCGLIAIFALDTSKVTTAQYMCDSNFSLRTIPKFDTSKVVNAFRMFYGCYSLTNVTLDLSSATRTQLTFGNCASLKTVCLLNTAKLFLAGEMYTNCPNLVTAQIPGAGGLSESGLSNIVTGCTLLSSIKFSESFSGWRGSAISLKNCALSYKAIKEFFDSLPTITFAKEITLTGNPGVPELTDADKAIATQKGWTLTL